jgi:hypothetical protein
MTMITLKLDNSTTSHYLIAGRYDIYILGGLYIEMSPIFKIKIINPLTNEPVSIYERSLKTRTFDGIAYFYCNVPMTGEYLISFKSFENIVLKKSILRILRHFQSKLDVGQIRIGLERK